MTTTLFVNYKLIEDKSNRELWKENILSQYDSEVGGAESKKKANEGAARDNLSQLVKKLSNVIIQLEQKLHFKNIE